MVTDDIVRCGAAAQSAVTAIDMYFGTEEARVTCVTEGRTGDIEIVVIDTADELVIV